MVGAKQASTRSPNLITPGVKFPTRTVSTLDANATVTPAMPAHSGSDADGTAAAAAAARRRGKGHTTVRMTFTTQLTASDVTEPAERPCHDGGPSFTPGETVKCGRVSTDTTDTNTNRSLRASESVSLGFLALHAQENALAHTHTHTHTHHLLPSPRHVSHTPRPHTPTQRALKSLIRFVFPSLGVAGEASSRPFARGGGTNETRRP
jgi:hypothetical protein